MTPSNTDSKATVADDQACDHMGQITVAGHTATLKGPAGSEAARGSVTAS